MKRKLFLFLCALLTSVGMWADKTSVLTDAGWTQKTSLLTSDDIANNYFIFVEAKAKDMAMSEYDDVLRPSYRTIGNPVSATPYIVWELTTNGDGFDFRNVEMQSGYPYIPSAANSWDTHFHSNKSDNTCITMTVSEGKYTLKYNITTDQYIGHWADNDDAPTEGENIAGNKASGHATGFYIYAYSKSDYLNLRYNDSATEGSPQDVTFLINNANFICRSNSGWDWSGTSGNRQYGAFTTEAWNNNNVKFSQNLTSLKNGKYRLTAQIAVPDEARKNNISLYATGASESTASAVVYDFPGSNQYNSVSDHLKANRENCKTSLDVAVIDGTLEIGIKDVSTGNGWMIFDNFKLYYLGEDLQVYIDAYNTAMDAAEAFTEESMFADDWTALQNAISDNTLDTSDPDLTKNELITATSNLNAANAAATAAVASKTTYDAAVTLINGGTNVSVTSLIVNPSFESDFTGWTNVGGMAIQTNNSFGKTGNKYAEYWQPNGTKSVSQTIGALPAGIYTLQLRAKARGVTSAKLFANSNEQPIAIEDNENEYSLTFEIADKESINIGFEGVGTGAGASWLAIDNFRLTYVGTVDDLTYTKATGKMGTDKSAAQDAAEATFLANKTLANYNALIAAISDAEASKVTYDKLKAAIDNANVIVEKTNFVTAAATAAFQDEIDDATTAWTNVTYTDAECNTEIATLGSTASGWHAIGSEGKAGAYIASTWGKTSENWWTDFYINTWSTEGDNDGSGFSVPFFEYYVSDTNNLPANTFTATLTGLDNGMYEVEIWARAQRRSDADFNGDNTMITMFVNGGNAVSIMNGSNIEGYDATHTMRLGRFAARGEVTDGTLTLSIDVKLGSNVHWLSWRDVKYTKLDEANMAVNAAAEWGTFCAPFAVEIPSGVTAYTCESASDGVLDLVQVEGTTIGANTPVILNAEGGLASTTFYGVKVANESDDLITGGMLRGNVGTATKNVPYDGSAYLLQRNNNKTGFYQVTGDGYKIGYNRCYLVESGEITAREAFFFEDEGETAINEIEAVEAKAKGLKDGKYLINGRIVVVNNGKAFGANGQILK